MKKPIFLMLVTLCLLSLLVSCNNAGDAQGNTTAQMTESKTQASTAPETTQAQITGQLTEEKTEAPTSTDVTTEQVTDEQTVEDEPTTDEEPTTEEETTAPEDQTTTNELGFSFEIIDIPVGYYGDSQMMRGYNASGAFYYDEELGCLYADSDDNIIVVTNDTMDAGTLSATFLSAPGYINDNGIIFGLEDSVYEEDHFFWEFGPAYYFLFISDAGHLYLAKAGYNGQPWTELEVTEQPLPDYVHGETNITIKVEFDGQGTIKCYANGALLIDYFDTDPIRGNRYGVRCEVFGVEYYNISAIHD